MMLAIWWMKLTNDVYDEWQIFVGLDDEDCG